MQFACPNCKLTFPCEERDYPITCRCGIRATLEQKNIVYRYIDSVKNWRANGSPVRTEEEISNVLAICKSCEHYNNGICEHKQCGCTLSTSAGGHIISRIAVAAANMLGIKPAMFEKVKMSTEHCPVNLW